MTLPMHLQVRNSSFESFSHSPLCAFTDDIQGWQDAVLKSLERKHRAEQEFLMSLLQDESSKDMREEARAVSEDDRLKRLNELKAKREELDFGVKGKFK